jgi:predicted nuclease of restriction endonuclease-like (RecB) superfamily
MKLNQLVAAIASTHEAMRNQAVQSVNAALTVRNWLIGYYIVEFEQKGEDRANYGGRLLELIGRKLQGRGLKGISLTTLKMSRDFYKAYPQIGQTVSDQFKQRDLKAIPVLPVSRKIVPISQTLSDQFTVSPKLLLERLSFSHFSELIKVDDDLKRAFYESQAIKGHWSFRELKRQIGSLLFERLAKSQNKAAVLKRIQGESLIPEDIIKSPYVFEFLGIPERSEYTENQLETALINHLQAFLMELGKGFCFEARQKRITVNNQHHYIDLVFYHRILKCHVLIELKIREFNHTDAGQMNFYLNYMQDNEMEKGDNPPVGIILCTHDQRAEVKYAVAGLNNKLFVSRYKLKLPTEKELREFITKDIKALEGTKEGR